MAKSAFADGSKKPTEKDIEEKLSRMMAVWKNTKDFISQNYPDISEEWLFYKNYGWTLRVKSKKRTILYFTPCPDSFIAGLVYGNKATEAAMNSDLSKEIREIIQSARVYAEGRSFRVEVKSANAFEFLKDLIVIKMNN